MKEFNKKLKEYDVYYRTDISIYTDDYIHLFLVDCPDGNRFSYEFRYISRDLSEEQREHILSTIEYKLGI